MTRVMVVEDDENLRVAVGAQLVASGLEVHSAPDLASAHRALSSGDYACVVFDRLLPDGDAVRYVHDRRRAGWTVPVLFLTALDNPVEGFTHGGDDYLVKPFAADELTARVRSLCRRAGRRPSVLRVGDLEVDCARREVRRAGVLLTLSGKEFAVLEQLAVRAGQVVSRSDLIEHCWDAEAEPVANVVDAVIKRLRRKLRTPELIHTVTGHGYRLGPT